jgi:hypothetical protein
MTKENKFDRVVEITRGLLSSGHYTGPVSDHDPRPGYRAIRPAWDEKTKEETKHFNSELCEAALHAIKIVDQIEWLLKASHKAK